MTFAAKIAAEPGWKVVLSKEDGGISVIDIKEWGLSYARGVALLIPLDSVSGNDITKRENFIRLIDPNDNVDIDKFIKELKRNRDILSRGGSTKDLVPYTNWPDKK